MAQRHLHFSEPEELQASLVRTSRACPGADTLVSIIDPLSVRVREACRLTGIGRSTLYELIAAGEIEVIKVGTITLIPKDALRRFLDARRAS